MPYFSRDDAVDARQVTADEEVVTIFGVGQKALRGDWIITRPTGRIDIVRDDWFRKNFIQL